MRLILMLFLAAPLRAETPLVVFAAASLGGALDEVAAGFGQPVTISYAGSATLARQIEAGAPADLVILANQDWMDRLAASGAVVTPARTVLSNRMVLAVPAGADPVAVGDDLLAAFPRIATGFVDAVPVGIYAREALQGLGLWDAAEPRLVQTENARLALALVARGDVDAGFVYRSDAQAEPGVRIHALMDATLHSPIRYPAAVTAHSPSPDRAAAFLALLTSPEAVAIFLAHGYEPPA